MDTEKPVMWVIIAGGRDFEDYDLLKSVCDNMLSHVEKTHRVAIVSGGAKGADTLAIRYANEREYELVVMLPDWEKYGKSAGFIRNAEMAEFGSHLIAFWDSGSAGTKNMIEVAKRKYLIRHVVSYLGTVLPV